MLYFILFATSIMIVLWVAQVFFLNHFYSSMKTAQTYDVANTIEASFRSSNNDNFLDNVSNISESYDMYIFIVSYDGTTSYFTPHSEGYISSHGFTEPDEDEDEEIRGIISQYSGQIQKLNDKMINSNCSADMIFRSGQNSQQVLAYGDVLHSRSKSDVVLYIFSPLWPVSSTVKILTKQLLIVTIMSFFLACILSCYLSLRITRPIRKMERSAKRLASGEYGIVFKGGHYSELINLADTLTSASIALEKSDLVQRDLIANVSHDLRTPLTLIKSYAEMIKDISGDNPQKREEHLQVIIKETDRLNTLVEDMLSMSRMQSGKISLEKSDFNLSESISDLISTYKVMEDEGYTFNINCADNIIVNADEEKIKQVVSNLVSNAIKFCGEKKTIDISLLKRGHKVRFTVNDHGIGIAPEDLDHIWDRYYRASSNTVRVSEGTGLGLAICKEILTLHKAEFGVDSTLGQGSKFWFELNLRPKALLLRRDNSHQKTT